MPAEWLWHIASVAVVVYCGSLMLVSRGPSGCSTPWDGWIGNIASIIVVAVLLRIQRTEILRGAQFTSIRLDGIIAGLTIASAAAFWWLGPVWR